MTKTDTFYSTDVFSVDVDFTDVEVEGQEVPRHDGTVTFRPSVLLAAAGITMAGILSLVLNVQTISASRPKAGGADTVTIAEETARQMQTMTAKLRQRADLAGQLFVRRAHHPELDPDYDA